MKKLKKMIVILLIVALILIISIYFISKGKKEITDEEGNIEEPEYIEGSYEANNTIKELENKEEYFIIKDIIAQFQTYINYLDYDLTETRVKLESKEDENEFLSEYKQEGMDGIKNMMSKEYQAEFHISDATIYDNLAKYANQNMMIKDIYVSENSVNIKTYFVYLDAIHTEELRFVVIVDSSNNSFYIMLNDYMDKMDIKKEAIVGKTVEQTIQNVETNEYNTYEIPNISDARYVQELFDEYKMFLSNSPNKAYDRLDSEYRQKRFGDIQNFKTYVEQNSVHLLDMELSKYKINHYNDYTEYVCMDQFGNYLIFKEKKVMDYTVLLDSYTIDVAEFTERYDKSNEQEKVGMNIEKFILALNNKDYHYIYNKLDDGFKKNNFDSVEKFGAYIKQNLFDTNIAEYDKFSKEGKTYIYEIKVKASEENNADSKTVTVIMKLLEDTDFVMSFKIQ